MSGAEESYHMNDLRTCSIVGTVARNLLPHTDMAWSFIGFLCMPFFVESNIELRERGASVPSEE